MATAEQRYDVFYWVDACYQHYHRLPLLSGAIDVVGRAFHVSGEQQLNLLVAVFLIGYIFGPIVLGPLNESYGRRITLLLLYTVSILGCVLAPNWSAFLILRFIAGSGGAAPPIELGGLFADLYPGTINRGRAIMLLGLPMNIGPLIGPIIAGFVSEIGWNWMFWVSLMLTGVTWVFSIVLAGGCMDTIQLQQNADILARRDIWADHTRKESEGATKIDRQPKDSCATIDREAEPRAYSDGGASTSSANYCGTHCSSHGLVSCT